MKKKIPALILALLMVLSVTSGCGKEVPYDGESSGVIESTLAGMTLRDKIGQMIMVAARSWSDTPDDEESYENATAMRKEQLDAISEYGLCGVCLFAQNIEDTPQTVRLTMDIQDAAFRNECGIGALISIDQEGGYITRLTMGTSGIGNMALAATGDSENARKEAEIIGEELMALGINLDFAPDADVNWNPDNPVIGVRSFSDDPDVVSEYAGKFLAGLSENGVSGCLKHFPGHGDTDTDSHTGFPLIEKTYEEIKETELKPFAANCKASDLVMTAHIQFPKIETGTYKSLATGEEVTIPATMSKTIIKDILRGEMGFEGVVVTDALEMGAIADNFDPLDAARMIIDADVDILLMPFDIDSTEKIEKLGEYIDAIEKMVNDGVIDEGEIDDSVSRILLLKAEKGLLTRNDVSYDERCENALTVVGSRSHHDEEWEMALDAVTVYKNDGALPLSDDEKADILYLSVFQSQVNSQEFAIRKLSESGAPCGGISVTAGTYADRQFEDLEPLIGDAKVLILTSSTGALRQTDTSDPSNTRAIFCEKAIKKAHELGKKVIVISSLLPYDAEFYSMADAVLLCYNNSGMPELPGDYEGRTVKYGPNVPAAIYTVLSAE